MAYSLSLLMLPLLVSFVSVTAWSSSTSTNQHENRHPSDNNLVGSSRRNLFNRFGRAVVPAVASILVVDGSVSQRANAQDELFKKNPLTNPVLEQVSVASVMKWLVTLASPVVAMQESPSFSDTAMHTHTHTHTLSYHNIIDEDNGSGIRG